jgi:octopine/nopaline transport system permease protein/arginine/ornithine transport system permease protein
MLQQFAPFFESLGLEPIWNNLPRFFWGLTLTLEVTALSVALGLLLAVPLALARVSKHAWLNWPVQAYTFYFRGTPLLVQLFLIYYGGGQFRHELEAAGLWTYFREPYFCAVLTLTLNTAAYTAEILRGAIQAVPFGEIEAARATGMSGVMLYRRIILPKAARMALPAYSNEVVFLFQATSIVSIITLMDLTGVARVIISRSFDTFDILFFIEIIYLAVSYAIIGIFNKVEYRLMGHLRDRPTQIAGTNAEAPTPTR